MSVVPIESPIEWMINRLWSFSAHDSREEINSTLNYYAGNQDVSRNKQENPGVCIPELILFRDGIPWKWIGPNADGLLIRKNLKISKNNNLFIQEQLQIIRLQLIHFQQQFSLTYPLHISDESNHHVVPTTKKYLCRIFYKSGEEEKITLEGWLQYEMKVSSSHWWQSVLAVQSWMPEFKSGVGVYHRFHQPDIIVDPASSWPSTDRNKSLDVLTEKLILWISPSQSRLWESEDDSNKLVKNGADINHIVIKFHIMTASNDIWFSQVLEGSIIVTYSSRIFIENDEIQYEEETLHSSQRFRQKLLTMTPNEMEALFLCWDQDHDGFVVAADLQRDLPSLLGIPISIQASERLIAIIGRTTPFHFAVSDLKHYTITSPISPRCVWMVGNRYCTHETLNIVELDTTPHSISMFPDSLGSTDPETDSDSDSHSFASVRCSMIQEMNDLSIDDVPHVKMENIELGPLPAAGLVDGNIVKKEKSNHPYESKIQAILEGTNKNLSCAKLEDKPLITSNLYQLSTLNLKGCAYSVFIVSDNMVNLLNYKSHTLEPGALSTQRFIIHNGLKQKVVSLDISIVYSGTFVMGKYIPGVLRPSLRFQPLDSSGLPSANYLYDESISNSVVSVGDIKYTTPSDNGKFGQVVISFTNQPFVPCGVFELTILAETLTRYSVSVCGKACIYVEDVICHKLHHFFRMKEILEGKMQGAQHCWFDLRAEERKFHHIVDLVNTAEYDRKRSEFDLDQNESLYLSSEYDEQYHVLKHLNWDFSFFCRLLSFRQRQLEDILSRFRCLCQVRFDLSKSTEYLRNQTSRLMILLLNLIEGIHGIDDALNAKRIMNSSYSRDCVKAESEYSCSLLNSSSQTVDGGQSQINPSHISCVTDTDLFVDINFESPFHDDGCPIDSDLVEGIIGISSCWGFWQPRPLPLLRSTQCSGEINDEGGIGHRLRRLILEQDRAIDSPDSSIMSQVLHDTTQLFPKKRLLIDIEYEIERIICNQIIDDTKKKVCLFNLQDDEQEASTYYDTRGLNEEGSSWLELNQDAYIDNEFHSPPVKYQEREKEEKKSSLMNEEPSMSWCMGCGCSSCHWKSSIDEAHFDQRRANISQEIITLKLEKTKDCMRTVDRLKDLQAEAYIIDMKIKLSHVDRELHDIYALKSTEFVIVRALHGYDSLMPHDRALYSLETERDRLLATLISLEMVDGVLEWMLQGWYFGENISNDGQNGMQLYDWQKLAGLPDRQTKLMEITEEGRRMTRICQARKESLQMMEALTRLEQNIRFFFLCLIFMYFRTLSVVQQQKEIWSSLEYPLISDERRVMNKEVEAVKNRKEAFDFAFRKFQRGARRIQLGNEAKAWGKAQIIARLRQSINKASWGSLTIQRVYRGHIGRKVYRQWSQEKSSYDACNALCHASAIAISCTWKGYRARRTLLILKKELAQFIIKLRKHDHECL